MNNKEKLLQQIDSLKFEIKVSKSKIKEIRDLLSDHQSILIENTLKLEKIVEQLGRLDLEYPPQELLTDEELDLIRFKEALPELLKKL